MKPNTVMMGFYDNIVPEDMLKNRMFPRRRRLLNYGLNGTLPSNASANYMSGISQFESILLFF